jgi:hypothetical protein
LLISGLKDVGGGLREDGEPLEVGIFCGGLRKDAMLELREIKRKEGFWL